MILAENLTKEYGNLDKREKFKRKRDRKAPQLFRAVNQVSFQIEDGEMVGIPVLMFRRGLRRYESGNG